MSLERNKISTVENRLCELVFLAYDDSINLVNFDQQTAEIGPKFGHTLRAT